MFQQLENRSNLIFRFDIVETLKKLVSQRKYLYKRKLNKEKVKMLSSLYLHTCYSANFAAFRHAYKPFKFLVKLKCLRKEKS
jgi:hypothetical protein